MNKQQRILFIGHHSSSRYWQEAVRNKPKDSEVKAVVAEKTVAQEKLNDKTISSYVNDW